MSDVNPLLDDRDVDFLLGEVHRADELLALPAFAHHSPETLRLAVDAQRRIARTVLFPRYRALDLAAPAYEGGDVRLHPDFGRCFRALADAGTLAATRPLEAGGAGLPTLVATAASAYLGAGGCAVAGLAMLTAEAAHLLEAFGDEALRARYVDAMYAGEVTGTMCLTEPHAGSSLGDITTRAAPAGDGTWRLTGSKIFISGGEHDLTDNIVHMVLARIEGAPQGARGVSLFCVPKLRPEGDGVAHNDVRCAGVLHKIGWRALPSVVLNFGEAGDCHAWLVGAPGRGLAQMFQMMNAARIAVGVSAVGKAYAAWLEALRYARERPQGRRPGDRAEGPQVPLVEHADVRRMLLRQKSIAEGALSLSLATAREADLAAHHPDEATRARARLLLDLLTPVAKTFPAERGFEANALSVQVHGGYGYTSEYLPELWLRDQKLNSIHEGTTGIQSLDLLGRKAVAGGGAALTAWREELAEAAREGRDAGVEPAWCEALEGAADEVLGLTAELGARGLAGDLDGMLGHAADYMDLFSTVCVAWQWMRQAAAAQRTVAAGVATGFHHGKLAAARYWFATELPRVGHLAALCRSGERSYLDVRDDWW